MDYTIRSRWVQKPVHRFAKLGIYNCPFSFCLRYPKRDPTSAGEINAVDLLLEKQAKSQTEYEVRLFVLASSPFFFRQELTRFCCVCHFRLQNFLETIVDLFFADTLARTYFFTWVSHLIFEDLLM